MLGKDLYKIEVNFELSSDCLKSLVFFYGPLVGRDSLSLYQYLVLRGSTYDFKTLNELLISLNISVDSFETQCTKLNEYRLLRTLKKDNSYIFVFLEPLKMREFIKDDVFVRNFILKTSGKHYQDLIADLCIENNYVGFEDMSSSLSSDTLANWSKEDETYLKKNKTEENFEFNTLFDINKFLKSVSLNLLPMRFRNQENMYEVARLADLYGISIEKMRSFIPKISKGNSNEFDLKFLRYLCQNDNGEYKAIEKGLYQVPCVDFLMNLQDGKQVSEYDRKIIYNLSSKYQLNIEVINVLIEHTLKNCNNSLIEKYLNALASDMHRNNVTKASEALERLNKPYNKVKKTKLPTYNTEANENLSEKEIEELKKLMGK